MEKAMSTLVHIPNYMDQAAPVSHSERYANWTVLARWTFLALGLMGTLVGGWMLLAGQPAGEDGSQITYACIVALLTGLLLIIDVLRTGSATERHVSGVPRKVQKGWYL
jgi:hypothetical protein